MNRVILSGRTSADLELKQIGTSREFTPMQFSSFTLCVNRDKKNDDGSIDTDFVQCSVYGPLAVTMAKYVHKGTRIAICGKLRVQVRDKNGERHTYYNVIVDSFEFLDYRNSSGGSSGDNESEDGQEQPSGAEKRQGNEKQKSAPAKIEQTPDELPF